MGKCRCQRLCLGLWVLQQIKPSYCIGRRQPGSASSTNTAQGWQEHALILGGRWYLPTANLMKPYSLSGVTRPQRIFNYHMSCVHHTVVNAFGILECHWRCLLSMLQLKLCRCTKVVQGCLTLHNFLCMQVPGPAVDADQEDEYGNVVPSAWRCKNNSWSPSFMWSQDTEELFVWLL